MNAGNVLSYLAITWAGILFVLNIMYIAKVRPDPVALAQALISLYFMGIYAISLCTTDLYLIRSGILTRLGVIVVLFLLALDTMRRWRESNAARID